MTCLIGCGGAKTSGDYRGLTDFVGSWRGTWTVDDGSGTDKSGSISLTIDQRAVVAGSLSDGNSLVRSIEGNVDRTGTFKWRAVNLSTNDVVVVSGRLSVGGTSDRLSGDGVWTEGETKRTFAFDAAPPKS